MNQQRISWYRAAWSVVQKAGSITLVVAGTSQNHEVHLTGLSPAELHAVLDILRNERPVFWDPQSEMIYTANEIVGEEEID
jgi:hypothetical protein